MEESLSNGLSLGAWEGFYVIVGTSAAALTGLTFIVITISAEGSKDSLVPEARLAGLRAFITPTVVHFGSALLLSALMSVPRHTAYSLAMCLGLSGVAGIAYCSQVGYWMFRTAKSYAPFASDWFWNVVLPLLAYLVLLSAALLLSSHSTLSLDIVGGLTLLLLFIGIRNAWDVVVWMTTERFIYKDRSTSNTEVRQAASPDTGRQPPT